MSLHNKEICPDPEASRYNPSNLLPPSGFKSRSHLITPHLPPPQHACRVPALSFNKLHAELKHRSGNAVEVANSTVIPQSDLSKMTVHLSIISIICTRANIRKYNIQMNVLFHDINKTLRK